MKRWFSLLLALWPLSAGAWEPELPPSVRLSGWASKAVVHTYHESVQIKVPQQEDYGLEAALRVDWAIQPWLDFRALYAYLPYLNDGPDSEFEFLLLDANTFVGESIAGVRAGRVQLPYGFFNMLRLNPAERLGVHHAQPVQIYWGQNAALYDRGDGWHAYVHSPRSSTVQGTLEFGRIVREDPQPQADYLFELSNTDIYFDRLETEFISLEIELFDTLRLRKDHLEPTQFFSIEANHYNYLLSDSDVRGFAASQGLDPTTLTSEQLLALRQSLVAGLPTGEFQRPFEEDYEGVELWLGAWQLVFEQSRFYYTGEGSQNEYYRALGSPGGEKLTDTHRSFVVMRHDENVTVHAGYSYMIVEDGSWRSLNTKHVTYAGTDRFGGIKWKYDSNLTVKYEVLNVSGIYWLRYSLNAELAGETDRNWRMEAVSITYEF
jgi:hypothetical protein